MNVNPGSDSDLPIAHNLGLYRLQGFSGRRAQLHSLHGWLTGESDRTALAITGDQGNGKSTLATAAAWANIHHFEDGVIWVGPAGLDRFRLYDVVRTLDSVLGTTLTRVSPERWGTGILEQLYRRRRLLILDELSGASLQELNTLVEIISRLHESSGRSRILLISREHSSQIAQLVAGRHLHLEGLELEEVGVFVYRRAPEPLQNLALRRLPELHRLTGGRPLSLRLLLGLLLDNGWDDLCATLRDLPHLADIIQVPGLAAMAVESYAAFHPHAGPLLERLVSAAGGATFEALRDLFWQDLGSPEELADTVRQLVARGLIERDDFRQRVLIQPVVRRYLEQGVAMIGESWQQTHAHYYVHLTHRYAHLPLEQWPTVDVEWGNIHQGADWCMARVEQIWGQDMLQLAHQSPVQLEQVAQLVTEPQIRHELHLPRSYAMGLAHYAFWRHPPGILRWLTAGAMASKALDDQSSYGWLVMNIGRQLFFQGHVTAAAEWLRRALRLFQQMDMLLEQAYAHTDLGTSERFLNRPHVALDHFWAAFEAVAQLGDQRELATAYMNLGSAYYSLHNYDKALTYHHTALRICLRQGDGMRTASAYNNVGLVLESTAQFDKAQAAYEQALAVFHSNADEIGISTCYNNLGSVCYARKDYQGALHWYELDLALSARRGAWVDRAATLHNLGHVAVEQQDLSQARRYFEASRDLYNAFQLGDFAQEEEEMLRYIATLS